RRQYQYDARRQQGDGGGVFGDNQFTCTLSVNFHFPRIPRRTIKKPAARAGKTVQACQVTMRTQRMKTGFNSL
ncbi:hypothetical protein ACV1D8_20105, partial [Aeromonas caviae]